MTRARRRQGGFTLIEVMMSLAIMVAGSVGIIALQRATVRANGEAREFSMATEITRTWLETLRRDALRWTAPGAAGLATTSYLASVPGDPATLGDWFTPAGPDRTAFNYLGQAPTAALIAHYCVNVRLRWTSPNNAIRSEVRTWWHRRVTTPRGDEGDRSQLSDCAAGQERAVTNGIFGTYTIRAVQAATVVRWTSTQ